MMKSGIGEKKSVNKFISTSRKRIKKLHLLEEWVVGTCPEYRNPKLRFDGKIYTSSKCGYEYK
jgi:hypothetical protein